LIDDANGVAVMKVSDDQTVRLRPHVCRRVVVADSALRVRVGDRIAGESHRWRCGAQEKEGDCKPSHGVSFQSVAVTLSWGFERRARKSPEPFRRPRFATKPLSWVATPASSAVMLTIEQLAPRVKMLWFAVNVAWAVDAAAAIARGCCLNWRGGDGRSRLRRELLALFNLWPWITTVSPPTMVASRGSKNSKFNHYAGAPIFSELAQELVVFDAKLSEWMPLFWNGALSRCRHYIREHAVMRAADRRVERHTDRHRQRVTGIRRKEFLQKLACRQQGRRVCVAARATPPIVPFRRFRPKFNP
jgi:hypothetical protein